MYTRNTRNSSLFMPAFAIVLMLIWPIGAGAVTFAFTKIADSGTTIPGQTTPFGNQFFTPSVDGGRVSFWGGWPRGVFIWSNGSLGLVADKSMTIPDGTGLFYDFGLPSINGSQVAFRAYGFNQSGVYLGGGGTLTKLADLNDAIPSGTGNFTQIHDYVSYDGDRAVFRATGASSQHGLYASRNGTLTKLIDRNTAVPDDADTFASSGTVLGYPMIDSGLVVFEYKGVFTVPAAGGTPVRVCGGPVPVTIPGGIGDFTGCWNPSIGAGMVAFFGSGSSSQAGVYTWLNGMVKLVADKNTPVPGGTGVFAGFSGPSADGGNVAFIGRNNYWDYGIYTNMGGTLVKVIDDNDTLDGKTVSYFDFYREGLGGTGIAFEVGFTDGTSGIYLAKYVDVAANPAGNVIPFIAPLLLE